MDFSQVRYFLALAETLNFTRAAEACNVTQPTLTQAIKRLEAELGGELVLRDGRHTRLSPLGRALRGHFEQIAETRRLLAETARAVTRGEEILVNVGIMCTVGPRVLYRFLEAFRERHPQARLVLHDVATGAIADLLLSGAIDGAFCARHDRRHDKLDYVHLFDEAMVVAFPPGHPFAERETVPLADVVRERYVDRLYCEFRNEISAFAADLEIEVDVAFTSQREDWIQNMVRAGAGVSVIPEYSLLPPPIDHRPIVDPALWRRVEFATVHGGPKGEGLRSMIAMADAFPWGDLARRR